MRSVVMLVSVNIAIVCVTSAASAKTITTKLSLQNIDCQSCGTKVVQLIKKRPTVTYAAFDVKRAEVTVKHDTKASPAALLAIVKKAGYRAVIGGGKGYYQKDVRFDPKSDVQWISRRGEDVDINKHRAAGKVTVFDFYAKWCGPCKKVDREMRKLLARHKDLALRKINMVDWNTPVTKRYLKKVPTLPYVIVYGRRGKRVAAIAGLKLEALRKAIAKGRSQ